MKSPRCSYCSGPADARGNARHVPSCPGAHRNHPPVQVTAYPNTLRARMHYGEGVVESELAISRGLTAWAIERRGPYRPRGLVTFIVFGRNQSDALRRVNHETRLGPEMHGDETTAKPIASGWDEPIAWPFPKAVAA